MKKLSICLCLLLCTLVSPAMADAPSDDILARNLGDACALGAWVITPTAFDTASSVGNILGAAIATNGYEYVRVYLTVENTAATAAILLPEDASGAQAPTDLSIRLLYGEEDCGPDRFPLFGDDLTGKSLNPGARAEGLLAFNVPVAATGDTLTLALTLNGVTVHYPLVRQGMRPAAKENVRQSVSPSIKRLMG